MCRSRSCPRPKPAAGADNDRLQIDSGLSVSIAVRALSSALVPGRIDPRRSRAHHTNLRYRTGREETVMTNQIKFRK